MNIHDTVRLDDLNGCIIGGFLVTGALFYDGRRQGAPMHLSTEEALLAAATDKLSAIKQDLGVLFECIFPKDAWSLRIYP